MRAIWLPTWIALAAVIAGDAHGATVDWSLTQAILRTDQLVAWTSPTPIDDGLPSHDFDYEITSVGIFYGGLITPDDETSEYTAANDMVGSGRVGRFPATLWTQTLTEPDNGTSFDLDFTIDADGYGQATFTNIALGSAPADFGMNRIPIDALVIDIEITVVGNTIPLGDYNLDSEVDAGDYLVWLSGYASTNFLAPDGNGDGVVDAADYTVWRDNLTAPAAAVSVPEPRAVWLGAVAIGLLLRRH